MSLFVFNSWAGLDDGRHSNEALRNLFQEDQRKIAAKRRILSCDTLIIDEISMISAKIFSQLDFICRAMREVNIINLMYGDSIRYP